MTDPLKPCAEELKSCPFCGGDPYFRSHDDQAVVFCGQCSAKQHRCHASLNEKTGDADVRNVWNRRARTPAPAPQEAMGGARQDITRAIDAIDLALRDSRCAFGILKTGKPEDACDHLLYKNCDRALSNLDYLRAALSKQALAASGWQPIETANKDEQIIGAIWTGTVFGFPFEAEYNEENNKWESLRITEILPHNPTHWFDFSLMKATAAMREGDLEALKREAVNASFDEEWEWSGNTELIEKIIDHLNKRGLRVGEK